MSKGNTWGTRWRGHLKVPQHAHPFVRLLFRQLNSQHCTMIECAEKAGLWPQTIGGWRDRRNPTLPNIEAALNVMGTKLVAMPISPDLDRKDEGL